MAAGYVRIGNLFAEMSAKRQLKFAQQVLDGDIRVYKPMLVEHHLDPMAELLHYEGYKESDRLANYKPVVEWKPCGEYITIPWRIFNARGSANDILKATFYFTCFYDQELVIIPKKYREFKLKDLYVKNG